MRFWKKAAAALCAGAMLCGGVAVLPASAEGGVSVAVDQVELTLEELAAKNYQVPVYVRLLETPALDAVEFGVTVDERCTYTVENNAAMAMVSGGEMTVWSMTYYSEGPLTWAAWVSDTPREMTGPVLLFMVTVPEDARAGDEYSLTYVSSNYKNHLWNNTQIPRYYVKEDAVTWTDGYIRIMPEPMKGDANCDGEVSILDVIKLNKNLLAGETISEQGAQNADVDGDSKPSVTDSMQILKYVIKLVDAL